MSILAAAASPLSAVGAGLLTSFVVAMGEDQHCNPTTLPPWFLASTERSRQRAACWNSAIYDCVSRTADTNLP